MDDAEPQPIPLTRRGDLRENWFDAEPRYSIPVIESIPPPGWRASIYRSLLAGIVAGVTGGLCFTGIVTLMSLVLGLENNVPRNIGAWITDGALTDLFATLAGVGVVVAIALATTLFLSVVTRHVRRATHLVIFGVIVMPSLWLSIDALMRVYAPSLAVALPVVPMTIGWLGFGACFGLLPPLREDPID